MSERKVREYAQHKEDCAANSYMARCWGAMCNCGLKEALSADPDLVALLRWLGAEATALYESEGHNSPMARAHDETADYIESELGVRLTDDGWEWADED